MEKSINIKVKVWRQAGPKVKGMFETYELNNISTDASFLEMIDILNEKLVQEHKEPHCIRPRLPRRYMRYVFAIHQRTSARSRPGYYYLSAPYA